MHPVLHLGLHFSGRLFLGVNFYTLLYVVVCSVAAVGGAVANS